MFKAIGRWGSHVRSTLNIPFLSSIFGSKAKKYGDLDNDEEDIFVDAEEDIHHEDENLDDKHILRPKVSTDCASTREIRVTKSQDFIQDTTTNEVVTVNCDTKDKSGITTTEVEVSICSNGRETDQCLMDSSSLTVPNENHQEANEQNDSGNSSENDDDNNEDDHHVNHKDTKKMMKNSKSSNGIVQSASAAVLKVHRRVNSYSQRQYAKFDNAQDDENDNIVQHEHVAEISYDYGDDIDTVHTTKSEKKTKRRKKIAKGTRKAVRGSWKWLKRSMLAYSYSFNFASLFVINVASTARK